MKSLKRILWLSGVSIFLSGCATSPSPTFLNPNSLIAGHEAALYRDILIEAATIFVIIAGALIWILSRYGARANDNTHPIQLHGKLAWALIPVILILALDGMDFTWMVQTMTAVAAPAVSPQDINLHVIGHQWWWEFDYTDLHIKTGSELHIPVGAHVKVTLDSVDVIHSFWTPQISGKTDVIPGQTNHMWLVSDQVGEYLGQCAEFCGTEHALMRIKVIVQSQTDFDAWVANQQKPAAQPVTADEAAGYKTLTSTCASCHSLNPDEPEKKIGPNLAHLYSRSVFAGGVYELNDANLENWLKNTQSMKPGNDMNLQLSPTEVQQALAYLKLLK